MSGFDPIRNTGNPALQPGRSSADRPMMAPAVSYPARPSLINPAPGAGNGQAGGGTLPGSVAPGGGMPNNPMMGGAFAPTQGGLPPSNTANPAQAGNLPPELMNQGQQGPSSQGAFGTPSNLTQMGVTGLGANSQGGMTFGGGSSGFGRGMTGGRGMVGAAGGFGRR